MRRKLSPISFSLPLAFFFASTGFAQERLPVMNEGSVRNVSSERRTVVVQKAQKVVQRANRELNLPLESDIRGNNNTGTTGIAHFTQSETSVLAFGNTVVIGYNDAGSNSGGANKFTGWSYSTDGGNTFVDGGTLPNTANGDAGDPVLGRDNVTGRIYFSTLQFSGSGIQIFRSDDNAVTWMAPVQGTPGKTGFQDKQWLTVDNFPGSGQGNVYLVTRDFGPGNGIYFYRSTDQGATFTPAAGGLLIAAAGGSNVQGAYVAVGPDHSVYAFWYNQVDGTLRVRRSTDQGLSFGPPVVMATGLVGGVNGDLGLTGQRQGTASFSGFRSNEFPHVAINPVSGHLYTVFANNPAGTDKADVFLVQSIDQGATWSAPIRVNDDATTTDQWQPTVAVMPDGLQVGIFYYSRQEDAANNNLFKYYGRIARVSGPALDFGVSFAVSDVASLPEFGRDNVVNSVYMGDYDQTTATQDVFHVVWADNRDDLPNGNGRKDPNVYYEKILSPTAIAGKNISLTPVSINFGGVAVGQSSNPAQIVISNIGDQPLTINSITPPGGDFSVAGAPALPHVIPVGDYILVTATFSPTASGVQNASITVNSDAINTPAAVVSLEGEGVPPPANDACSNAIAVSCGSSTAGSTTYASTDAAPTCNGVTNTGKGVWYSITGTGYPITASLCTGTFFDSKLSVYSGTCGALVCTDANDNFCNTQSQVTWNSVNGTTYYILVHGTAADDFILTITCPPLITATPSPLNLSIPYNTSGSGQLAIANAAGSSNLNWYFNDLNQPYVVTTSKNAGGPVFNWTDIRATGTAVSLPDDGSSTIILPFSFPYFGINKNSVAISSNGFLGFGSVGTQAFTNVAIPTATNPNDIIAAFWDDLIPPSSPGTVHYLSTPSQFIVQYTDVKDISTSNRRTFQIILNADGTILFQYLTMQGNLTSATVGIENQTGTQGIQLAFNSAFVEDNLAVRFSFKPVSTCSWITSISPFIGTTAGGSSTNVTVGVDASGLNCGIYNCDLTINSNAANAPALVVPVVLNVTAPYTCAITSVPSNNVYTGGVPTNIYLGYGPQSTKLQTTVTGAGGPFTYLWTGNGSLSSMTSAAPVFAPTAPGIYTFQVAVSGAGGCATTCSITIRVYDVRVPGTNGKKVYLCHAPVDNPANAQTLSVSINSVPEHLLNHPGDKLGMCGQVPSPKRQPIDVEPEPGPTTVIAATPNPTSGSFTLRLANYKPGRLMVTVTDAEGRVVERRQVIMGTKGQIVAFDLAARAAGLYFVQVTGSGGTQTLRVLLAK